MKLQQYQRRLFLSGKLCQSSRKFISSSTKAPLYFTGLYADLYATCTKSKLRYVLCAMCYVHCAARYAPCATTTLPPNPVSVIYVSATAEFSLPPHITVSVATPLRPFSNVASVVVVVVVVQFASKRVNLLAAF